MTTSRKSHVSGNSAQNLVSGVLLCLAQIPMHFNVSPEVPTDRFLCQANYLKRAVDITTSLLDGLDYAAWQLMTATRDLVETGAFELNLSLPEELAETLLRDRYIDPYVTIRFFHKCLRGPSGHHVKALYDNDRFLHSAAKYVLLRVRLQKDNLLSAANGTTNDLLTIENDIFAVADKNKLWMKLDEASKRVEEKLDMVERKIDNLGEVATASPAHAKPRKRKRGVGGRGPQTECMKRQMKEFKRFLATQSYDGNLSKIFSLVTRFWLLNKAMFENQRLLSGQMKGYSSVNALVQAYRKSH